MTISKEKFRNNTNGYYLKGLFYETTLADKTSVSYTLKNEDHVVGDITYPSLYRLYLELEDTTEYVFANTYLFNWEHWERLVECNWFKPYLERWRKELELKLKAQSLARIKAIAKTSSKETFMANKYLLERGWEPKDGQTKRGRPSTQEIKNAAQDMVSGHLNLDDDFNRITLTTGKAN